jgi:flavoprotein
MGYIRPLVTILHSLSHNETAAAASCAIYLTSLSAQSRSQVRKVALYMARNNCKVADTCTERCNKAITRDGSVRSPEHFAGRSKVNNLSPQVFSNTISTAVLEVNVSNNSQLL